MILFNSLLLSGCSFRSTGEDASTLRSIRSERSIPYSVEFTLAEENSEQSGATSPDPGKSEKGNAEGQGVLLSDLESNSQLVWLRNDLPDSRVGLERRLLEDMETAKKILHSNGYYDGVVSRRINWEANPIKVRISLRPGQQYVIGSTHLRYSGVSPFSGTPPSEEEIAIRGKNFMHNAPENMSSFGLAEGTPATAASVFTAVERVLTTMHNQGYPFAKTKKTHYVIDRSDCTLDADVEIETGPLLSMGSVTAEKSEPDVPCVNSTYLTRLTTWTYGQYWNDTLLMSYQTALQETGLFSSIILKPDISVDATESGVTPVSLSVRNGPQRTVSGGMHYSTDTGFGVRASWEHRNLFGGGEQLRISAPVAEDSQRLSASFRKPAFGRKNQALVGEAELVNEETDAYKQTAAYVAGGLERRFSGNWRNWWASARLSLEGGTLDDTLDGKQEYLLVGIPLTIKRDSTDDLFNPTQGTRLSLSLTPYTGTYNGALTTIRTRADASGYWAPFANDRLVLAARAAAGSLTGEKTADIPASLRFYTGGGGSVRGYEYQFLGPKDRNGDPIGGLSFNDVGLEARFRITEQFGIVPFLDGGMVYDSSMPEWWSNIAWSVGLGFRYYTVIGPVRLDIATPLQDRDDNKSFQIYLSIGQAF